VDAKRVVSAFVSEVSVLPPGVEPAEPLAEVLWIGEPEVAAGDVFYGDGTMITRYGIGQVLGVR
jgi:hypothetical protein